MPQFSDIIRELESKANGWGLSPNDQTRLNQALTILRMCSEEKFKNIPKGGKEDHLRFWLDSLPSSELIKLMEIYIREETT